MIPVARKLWMPSLVAILLQKRACQRPALAAAEVRNMPLSPPAPALTGALPLGMIYYFAILLFLAAEAVHDPDISAASLETRGRSWSATWRHCLRAVSASSWAKAVPNRPRRRGAGSCRHRPWRCA